MKQFLENMIIIVLLMVIFIFLYPFVLKIIENSKAKTAISNTNSTVSFVNDLFYNEQINGDVELPFKVVFNDNGYKIYSNNQELPNNTHVKNKQTLPKSGYVIIEGEGKIYGSDLKFYDYKCNEDSNGKIECSKK